MLINISNQKPTQMGRYYDDPLDKAYNVDNTLNQIITDKIFNPLSVNNPVVIKDVKSGNNLDTSNLNSLFKTAFEETYNQNKESYIKELLSKTLFTYNVSTNLPFNYIYQIESAFKEKMPEPSIGVIYTPLYDVIPNTKSFLAGQSSKDVLLASYSFTLRANTFGIAFANEIEFNNFKDYLNAQSGQYKANLNQETLDLLTDFNSLKLNRLSESLLLREDQSEALDPYSFARILTKTLLDYEKDLNAQDSGQRQMATLPFTLSEFLIPQTMVFFNLEALSQAKPANIGREFDIIAKSLSNRPKMISMGKLTKLTTAQRAQANLVQALGKGQGKTGFVQRRSKLIFRKSPPNKRFKITMLTKILKRMSFVNRSQNAYKKTVKTYQKPNRRDPNDYNKAGKIASTRYKPDLHLYIDTSGSISEKDYKEGVELCIAIAKKLNVDLYFNSFSHVLSQTTLLKTKDKSKTSLYRIFRNTPKVSGGTDYANIWEFINSSKNRGQELSIVITDFGYTAPTRYIKHPKNLYYIPTNTDYSSLKHEAQKFIASMKHNDPNIRSKILM